MGEGNIGNQYKTLIKNVLYIDGLKHNLLSISQLCDKGFKIKFNKNLCLINEAMSSEVISRDNLIVLWIYDIRS